MTAPLLIIFAIGLIIGVPIAFVMGISTLGAFIIEGTLPLEVFAQRVFSGIDSFPMMTIPFFMLAADLMTGGNLTDLMLGFANNLVGHIRGGLGHVNVLVSVFFAGISGSALADAAGTGAIEMQMMHKAGYDKYYSASLTAASAVIGPIIPPSILGIMYALTDNRASVTGLFMAGVLPGLILAGALMVVNHIISVRKGYRFHSQRPTFKALVVSFIKAVPGMLMPLIILGGILSGIFTATEASAVAVAYALLVGFFITRALTLQKLYKIVVQSAIVSASVLAVVAMGSAFSWALTYAQVPQQVAGWVTGLTDSKILVMLLIMGVTMITGMFVDTIPALIILVPVLAPVGAQFGVDPLHLGMTVILSLAVGMLTPPVAPLLFVVSSVGKLKFEKLCVAVLPLLFAELAVILLITLVPQISTWLPHALGYAQ
ncbi:MAG TPA: TRAP transporter large permease [Symbiobacteriaceae bacterium]|nr:TRAP transporter large permease [Symbiobacteriaceae bacterium]